MASAQGTLRTLLAIYWLTNEAFVTGYPDWTIAYNETEKIYRDWLQWDQVRVLEHFIVEVESEYESEAPSYARRWAFESLVSIIGDLAVRIPRVPMHLKERWRVLQAQHTPTPPVSDDDGEGSATSSQEGGRSTVSRRRRAGKKRRRSLDTGLKRSAKRARG